MKERVRSYQSRIVELQDIHTDLSTQSRRLSLLRLAIIVIGFVGIFALGQVSATAVTLGVIGTFVLFAFVLKRHDRIDKNRHHTAMMIRINENEINALMRFENVYHDGASYDRAGHYYTNDLDVFGPFSLVGVINRCRTYHGNEQLAKWFGEVGSLASINERRAAVVELESEPEWRQDLFADLFEIEGEQDINFAEKVRNELDTDLDFINASWLKIYRKIIPFIWVALIMGTYMDWNLGSKLMVTFLLVNLGVSMKFVTPITRIQHRLSKSGRLLERFMKGLHRIMSRSWTSDLNRSKAELFTASAKDENNPIAVLDELKAIIDKLDYRLNIFATFFLNGTILWDIMMIDQLAQWKNNHLHKIEDIFGLIGHFEAVSSLSTWAYNHTSYSYAELDEDHFHLNTTGALHPLIPAGQNVGNDFNLDKEGRINIITGSNMAGKSTFLRTIGTNMILAYAGTKVAADKLQTSVVQIMSYMRIKDALEENVSTFKAELNRVELMLSLVQNKSKCLILIDEMLRGTNSKDKLKGSINITKKLIDEGAYTLIATHDIKLAELVSEYPKVIRNYYFDIDFQDGDLQFDYKLKKGICENFNASYLLKQIGIGE